MIKAEKVPPYIIMVGLFVVYTIYLCTFAIRTKIYKYGKNNSDTICFPLHFYHVS